MAFDRGTKRGLGTRFVVYPVFRSRLRTAGKSDPSYGFLLPCLPGAEPKRDETLTPGCDAGALWRRGIS